LKIIAGVDEVGRGPLAGPVIAAAVILPKNHTIIGLKDSKKLSKARRSNLFPLIYEQAISVGLGKIDVKTIDQINIREATLKAMELALNNLSIVPHKALIDGYGLDDNIIPNEGIIGGDDKIDSIKAASIIAKVTRDRIMEDYSIIFPEYGFETHSGYGTKKHMEALNKYRATPIHRRSFKPVKHSMPTIKWLLSNNRISWIGIKLAALYIKDKRMEVIQLEWRNNSGGYIDIIAKENNRLIFFDVRTIYKQKYQNRNEIIDSERINRLLSSINYYCIEKSLESNFRIDTISVILEGNKHNVFHNKSININ
tara:strand:+ start:161 stop:1093 length:933 start_codon:yes stop_codon:yes gene_type:complete